MSTPCPSASTRRPRRATLVILNRQRVRAINLRLLRRIGRALLEELSNGGPCELGINLVNAGEMARVNETFLQHAGSTDVITFDHAGLGVPIRQTPAARPESGLHGELFICLDDAVEHARAFRTTWQAELVLYIVHGVLHLCGHDDQAPAKRRVMKREENRLLRALSQRFDFNEL